MSRFNHIVLNLLILLLFILLIPPLVDWGIIKATWTGAQQADCREGGACWAMISARFSQFIYGFYPIDQRWRVNVAMGLLFAILALVGYKKLSVAKITGLFLVGGFLIWVLLHGGYGLPVVATSRWGGLFLTLVLAIGSIVCAFPLSILLALGRTSQLTFIKPICVLMIELVRGVPLISILFMASVMMPLFFPPEWNVDKLLRAFIGLTIFQAAYMAEVVRGGLNSLPKGQYEASYALGLNYWQMQYCIILPQALRVVIPGMVNCFIALFKDTTLVLIIGMYDFLGIVQAASTDPKWIGTALEAYIFCAFVYWVFCFSMSMYSKHLEKKLAHKMF